MKNKTHVIAIFSIIFIFLISGFLAVRLLQPKSFDKYGHYRWDAVGEIKSLEVVNQDIKTCAECHSNIYELQQKDAHYNVRCIVCHGSGKLHVKYHKGDTLSKKIAKVEAVMEKEYKLEGCLYCHRKLKARPYDFPQINKDEHYKFLNVVDSLTECIKCHSPHEPIFLLTEVKLARLHPAVYRCTDCHETKPQKNFTEVASHPTIFECKDCHQDLVKDFFSRKHHENVDCRTCHLFHKENESAGRMHKIGNAKFCLLCHEKKPFKDARYPPKIEWPSHIGDGKIIEKSDEKICLKCHADQIHKMNLKTVANPHPYKWAFNHKFFGKQKSNVCSSCHAKKECSKCHSQTKPLSHTDDWLDLHPDIAKKNKASCMTCHNDEFCGQCH